MTGSQKVLIVSRSLGTFLSRTEQGPIWSSQSDCVEFEAAPTFEREQAGYYLCMWQDIPDDLAYVQVVPDCEDGFASSTACAAAGAPAWLSLHTECVNTRPI